MLSHELPKFCVIDPTNMDEADMMFTVKVLKYLVGTIKDEEIIFPYLGGTVVAKYTNTIISINENFFKVLGNDNKTVGTILLEDNKITYQQKSVQVNDEENIKVSQSFQDVNKDIQDVNKDTRDVNKDIQNVSHADEESKPTVSRKQKKSFTSNPTFFGKRKSKKYSANNNYIDSKGMNYQDKFFEAKNKFFESQIVSENEKIIDPYQKELETMTAMTNSAEQLLKKSNEMILINKGFTAEINNFPSELQKIIADSKWLTGKFCEKGGKLFNVEDKVRIKINNRINEISTLLIMYEEKYKLIFILESFKAQNKNELCHELIDFVKQRINIFDVRVQHGKELDSDVFNILPYTIANFSHMLKAQKNFTNETPEYKNYLEFSETLTENLLSEFKQHHANVMSSPMTMKR